MNIAAAINSGAERLSSAGIAEYRREASALLASILNKEAVFLIAHPEYVLTESESASFGNVIVRRAAREPFHYIVGHKEFYGLDFEVSPGVLIPRPETEVLVEDAIAILSALANPVFYEVGVGSGCISVSVLRNAKKARASGVDISETALSLAARNAERHGVADRLTLRNADVYDGLEGTFDLIVSNPPYIPDGDRAFLQAEVGEFEPHTALFGGHDGLDVVRRIVEDAPGFLNPGGFLLIEIGFGQAEIVKGLFDSNVWEQVGFLSDLQNIPRITKSRLRG
jgi:release factor glutamine methyltransferase